MREALHIFAKDARHLWPRIAVWFGLLAAFGYIDATLPQKLSVPSLYTSLNSLSSLAILFLVASAIHNEELTGNRQYWITRPFSARGLLLAKALFIVVFVHLPILVEQSLVLVANGLSPSRFSYLPQILYRHAGILLIAGMAAALAVITRDLYQFAGAILASLAAAWAMMWVLQATFLESTPTPGRDYSVFGQVAMVLYLVTCAIICWLQYSRRATFQSIKIYTCLLLGMVLSQWLIPWAEAITYRHPRSSDVDPSIARLSLDAPATGTSFQTGK